MQIVGNYYSQTPVYERTNLKNNVKQKSVDYSFIQNAAIIGPNLSQSATLQGMSNMGSNQNSSNDPTQQYDVRNCTFDQFCTVAKNLYENKQISLFDLSVMTLDTSKIAPQTEIHGKINWIKEFQKRAEIEKSLGDIQSYNVNENIVGILNSLV